MMLPGSNCYGDGNGICPNGTVQSIFKPCGYLPYPTFPKIVRPGIITGAQDTGAWGLLVFAIKIMTAGVGILAVGGIAWGAILYASASDSAEQTKKAKDIIRNVVIGVICYALMYLVLNFLIPGGVFS
jgi:amino acid transporter